MKNFVTCHCHPQSLDSASTPEAFAKKEVELGTGAITCTDHGTLAAAYDVYSLGQKYNLTPIIGLEGYFRDDNCPILTKQGVKKTKNVPRGFNKEEWEARYPEGTFHEYLKYQHISLHFMDYEAFLCGVRLLSKADNRAEKHGQERKALFDWSDIEELASHNVTATSSCLVGMVQRHLLSHQNKDAAEQYFYRLKHLFGDRFYTEVFPHVCSHNFDEAIYIETESSEGKERLRYYFGKKLRTDQGDVRAEELAASFHNKNSKHKELRGVTNYRSYEPFDEPKKILSVEKFSGYIQNECQPWAPNGDIQYGCNIFVMQMARKEKVKIMPSDDSHFADPSEKVVQDVRLSQQGPWRFHKSYHRQSSEEAWDYFKNNTKVKKKTFEKWVENTHEWKDRFSNFKMESSPRLPTNFYEQDTLGYIKKLIKRHGRMVNKPEYKDRLKAEIQLLKNNGTIDLLPYFFIDEEICRFYGDSLGELTGPGRGSAAGLLLTYLLGITHVDPIKYGLSMERFLTVDRIKSGKLPDIDQDLPHRDPLVGWDIDVVEFKAEDGTMHVVPRHAKFETDKGTMMTIEEASEKKVNIKPWWLERNASSDNENK